MIQRTKPIPAPPATRGEEDEAVTILTVALIAEIERTCAALPPAWRDVLVGRAVTTLFAVVVSNGTCALHEEPFLRLWQRSFRATLREYRRAESDATGAPSRTFCKDAH